MSIPSLHRISDATGCNAISKHYIGPLLGNGALALFLDENGLMHDYRALPGRPAPRMHWAGRRLGSGGRPLVSFGLLAAEVSWEWMRSTQWEQALDVKAGMVVTCHERGQATENTETLLLLDRNLLAVHKSTRVLRGSPRVTYTYRLCAPEGAGLPEGMTILGGGSDACGAWLDYRLDGVVPFLGRIALWADRPCRASWRDNELHVEIALEAQQDKVTCYLALADDREEEMFYRQSGWGGRHADHPMLAPVIRELYGQETSLTDPRATIDDLRTWTSEVEWSGVRVQQAACWDAFWQPGWLHLPDDPDVQAIWESGMYATRTQLTKWSIPVAIHRDYFNGQYFPDEMAGMQALLVAGHWPVVQRIADLRLSALPLGMQMVDGAGARNEQPLFEGGHLALMPAGCSIYEVHFNWSPPYIAWNWYRYAGASRELLERYYPLFWGAAEFFRRWMVYRGPDGKYFTGACVDFNESIPAVRNGIATVSAAAGSLALAAQAADVLGRDADLATQWREMADGLRSAPPLNSRGLIAQYAGDEGVSFTALRAVAGSFSCGMIDPREPCVRRTLETALHDCKMVENWAVACARDADAGAMDANNPAAPTWTWLAALAVSVAARMRDGNLALPIIRELIRCSDPFGSLYECKVPADGFLSLPWFVTSMSELSAAISAMCIQCTEAYIDLLPAIPATWRNVAFQLAAYDRTTVQVTVRDGLLTALTLSGPGASRRVRLPARFTPEPLLGAPIARGEDWVEFVVPVA